MNSDLAITHVYYNDSLLKDGYTKAFEVDTKHATYQGRAWNTLSGFYKRKFESLIIMLNEKDIVKITYT